MMWFCAYSSLTSSLWAVWQDAFLISRPPRHLAASIKLVAAFCLLPHIYTPNPQQLFFSLHKTEKQSLIRKMLTRTTRQASRHPARLRLMEVTHLEWRVYLVVWKGVPFSYVSHREQCRGDTHQENIVKWKACLALYLKHFPWLGMARKKNDFLGSCRRTKKCSQSVEMSPWDFTDVILECKKIYFIVLSSQSFISTPCSSAVSEWHISETNSKWNFVEFVIGSIFFSFSLFTWSQVDPGKTNL